jgi:hypothetical protein
MACESTEGKYARHLFTIRENGTVRHRSPVCMRCGEPRKAPPPKQGRVKMTDADETDGKPLREEDVTRGDRLDDEVQEGEGLRDESDDDEADE